MAADEAEVTNAEWDHYSYVVSSRYRVCVLNRLARGPATPSQIASDADVRITHISRSLQELRDRGLADLLVSDDRKKGRVYGLTEDGRSAAELIEQHHEL